jgi:hypothetical protein
VILKSDLQWKHMLQVATHTWSRPQHLENPEALVHDYRQGMLTFFWIWSLILIAVIYFNSRKFRRAKDYENIFSLGIQCIHIYYSKQHQYLKIVMVIDVSSLFPVKLYASCKKWDFFLFAFPTQETQQWCYENFYINGVINNYLLAD